MRGREDGLVQREASPLRLVQQLQSTGPLSPSDQHLIISVIEAV